MANTLRDEISDAVLSKYDASPETDDLIDVICDAILRFIASQTS